MKLETIQKISGILASQPSAMVQIANDPGAFFRSHGLEVDDATLRAISEQMTGRSAAQASAIHIDA